MSTFQKRLLTEVRELCRQLFDRRVLLVREQKLVSDEAKKSIEGLLLQIDRLTDLNPFPEETAVDDSPLKKLKASLADPDNEASDGETIVMNWVQTVVPAASEDEAAIAEETEISAINDQMLGLTGDIRKAIDRNRPRLMLSNPSYNRKDYIAARNDFTLVRDTYDKRLTSGRITANVEDCSRVMRTIIPAINASTASTYPTTIQDAADFMRDRIFVIT